MGQWASGSFFDYETVWENQISTFANRTSRGRKESGQDDKHRPTCLWQRMFRLPFSDLLERRSARLFRELLVDEFGGEDQLDGLCFGVARQFT